MSHTRVTAVEEEKSKVFSLKAKRSIPKQATLLFKMSSLLSGHPQCGTKAHEGDADNNEHLPLCLVSEGILLY